MVPLAALILLGTVLVVATGTFSFAIYWTIRSRIEAKRLKDAEADNELRTPLTATNTTSGLFSRGSTPPPPVPPAPRPPTPEAEFPPPLPDDPEEQSKDLHRTSQVRDGPTPPFLLPATTYRSPTPEAEFPPPLPSDFPTRVLSPLPPHSPLLPPRPSLSPHDKNQPRSRLRSGGRAFNEQLQPPYPEDKVPERPDSMHEIYDIYSKLPPTPRVAPKSAPAHVATFAQAESKWAHFGEKRAENQSQSQNRGRVGEGNMI